MTKNNLNLITSLAFLIPALLSLYYQIYLHFAIILLLTIFSVLAHMKKKSFVKFDKTFAYILIIYNLYLLYLSKFVLVYTLSALFFVALSFLFYYKAKTENYNLNHSLWHLCSVVITIICILAYILA